MGLLLVLLLCLSSSPAHGETLAASLSVSPQAASELPSVDDLQAGIRRLFNLQFGSLVTLDFPGNVPADRAGTQAAQVSISGSGSRLTVTTDYASRGATRSLVSTLPRGSPASLLATAAGDLAFLFFSGRGLSSLPLSPPPSLVASLSTDALSVLTGWNRDELEPIALAASAGGIVVGFPHRYLTLGRRFQVTDSTIRDLNAQSLGREPLQLSGLVPAERGHLLLLSQAFASIVDVDRRMGTRTVIRAPGLSGLPARLAGPDAVVSLPAATGAPGLVAFPLNGGSLDVIDVPASYLSAMDVDGEGNLWVWDAGERRLRVVTRDGQEVFSIRPLLGAASMPLPQQLAVFDDGSFLLAGSGEVWKFQASGIPVWRLARVPGRPGESLPSSFDLCVDRAGGGVTILDEQSRRLLAFSEAPAPEETHLAAMLGRLDTRRPADVLDASRQALSDGLGLVAWQLADLATGSAGSDAQKARARIQILSEKALGYAVLADDLARGLLFERADSAYVRASAALREWSAEAPADASAATALANVLARRREVRAALLGAADLRIVSARLVAAPASACRPELSLDVVLRNVGAQPAADVRLHAAVPAAADAPTLAALDSLAAGAQAEITLPLGPAAGQIPAGDASVNGFALVTWQRETEGVTGAATFPVERSKESSPADRAAVAACRAVAQDTLAAGLADALLRGTRTAATQPLADLAGVMDALGAARAVAARPLPSSPQTRSMRAALRGLSPDEADWAVVTASVASSLGAGAAVISAGGHVLAAVDTGVPFFTALEALPDLARFQPRLAAISPGGTLWVPLSCAVAPAGSSAFAWSVAEGLRLLQEAGGEAVSRAALAQATDAPNAVVPFPLVLPSVTARLSEADLAAAVGAALRSVP